MSRRETDSRSASLNRKSNDTDDDGRKGRTSESVKGSRLNDRSRSKRRNDSSEAEGEEEAEYVASDNDAASRGSRSSRENGDSDGDGDRPSRSRDFGKGPDRDSRKNYSSSSRQKANISDEEEEWSEDSEGRNRQRNRDARKRTVQSKSGRGSSRNGASGKALSSEDSSENEFRSSASSSEDELGFGEDLMGDEEDRKRLAAMTEFEREQILSERHDRREAWKERRAVKKRMEAKKTGSSQHRGSRHSSKSSLSNRSSARRPSRNDRASAFSDIRAKKVSRASRNYQQDDDEDDGDSSQESNAPKPSQPSPERTPPPPSNLDDDLDDNEEKEDEAVTVDDLNKVRVTRNQLEKWVFDPWFEDTVKGLFVRFGVGMRDGRAMYRIGEIVAVKEYHKIYKIGNREVKKGLVLRGIVSVASSTERLFRMDTISNGPFEPEEYEKWKTTWTIMKLAIPTQSDLEQRMRILDEAENHVHTSAEIEQIVKAKEELGIKPRNLTAEKAQLLSQRDEAFSHRDMERHAELTERIEEIDKTIKGKRKGGSLEFASSINEKNRMINIKASFEIGKPVKKGEGMENRTDPFSRRPCLPRIHLVVSKSAQEEGASTGSGDERPNTMRSITPDPAASSGNGTPAPAGTGTHIKMSPIPPTGSPMPGVGPTGETATASPVSSEARALLAAHNVDIDIKVDLAETETGAPSPLVRLSSASKKRTERSGGWEESPTPPSKQRLSLKDYKQRMGLL